MLLDDIQDAFNFFFDDHYNAANMKYRKKIVLEDFEKVNKGKK